MENSLDQDNSIGQQPEMPEVSQEADHRDTQVMPVTTEAPGQIEQRTEVNESRIKRIGSATLKLIPRVVRQQTAENAKLNAHRAKRISGVTRMEARAQQRKDRSEEAAKAHTAVGRWKSAMADQLEKTDRIKFD